jgi:hypothetical protein
MSKLLSTYARSTGLQIGTPSLREKFFPLPFERYITLQGGSSQNAKCYDWYQEVLVLLKPILDANHIAILQLGGKDDVLIQGCHDLRGRTSLLQSYFLVKRGLCHVGNDSWLMHMAGSAFRPLVGLYGSTNVANHGPYWCDPAVSILLESHRSGGVPTFASQESPKTVNFISPESVANAVFKLLGIKETLPFSTRHIGAAYAGTVFELIPNTIPAPNFFPGAPMTVRMDKAFNEDVLFKVLQTGRKIHVITDRPINLGLLQQVRGSILSYVHGLGVPGSPDTPILYTDAIKSIFPEHTFFTRLTDEAAVAALRFTYFDHINVLRQSEITKADYIRAALAYVNRADTPENTLDIERELGHTRFKSNKFILSGDKAYLSHAHLAAGQATESLNNNQASVIDDPAFWRDILHMLMAHYPPTT